MISKDELLKSKINSAVRSDDLKAFKDLLAQGADPKWIGEDGASSLFRHALFYGSTSIIDYYIEQKLINLEEREERGYTPFLKACGIGNLKNIRYFMEKYPHLINDRSDNQTSPMLVAALNGHIEVVDYLLNNKLSSLTERNRFLYSAPICAVMGGHKEMLEYLIKLPGANLHDRTERWDALRRAVDSEMPVMIPILLKHGAYIDNVFDDKLSLEQFMVQNDMSEHVHYIVSAKKLLAFADKATTDPMDAVFLKEMAINESINARSSGDGNTALHLALMRGKIELAAKLIMGGATLNLRNHKDESAILWIRKVNNPILDSAVTVNTIMNQGERYKNKMADKNKLEDIKENKEKIEKLTSESEFLKKELFLNVQAALLSIEKCESTEIRNELKFKLGLLLADTELPIFNPKMGYHLISQYKVGKDSPLLKKVNKCLLDCIMADATLPKSDSDALSAAESDTAADTGGKKLHEVEGLDVDLDDEKENMETKVSKELVSAATTVGSKELESKEIESKERESKERESKEKEQQDLRLRKIAQCALDAEEQIMPVGNVLHQYIFGGMDSLVGIKGMKGKDSDSILALADCCKEHVVKVERSLKDAEEREARLRGELVLLTKKAEGAQKPKARRLSF